MFHSARWQSASGPPCQTSNPTPGWLFTIGGEVAFSNLSRWKRRLDAVVLAELRTSDNRAKLEPWRLHDLRHTLKTWMQQARIPEDVRNAVQNHYDGDMDELYGHYSFKKEKRDALTAWAHHIKTLIAAESHSAITPVANVVAFER